MVISHTLLAAWDAIISPTEIESIRQILHALHKTIMRRIILMSKHKLLPIALTFVLATALCSTIFAQSDITSTIDAFNDYVAADNIAQVSGSFPMIHVLSPHLTIIPNSLPYRSLNMSHSLMEAHLLRL